MYIDGVEIAQGCKILQNGRIREINYKIVYNGIDGDWSDAQIRGTEITEQMISDWLQELSFQGPIEAIVPNISLIGEVHADADEYQEHLELVGQSRRAWEQYKKPQGPNLSIKAIRLKFDATGSQERAARILRGIEESFIYVHQENGDWTCQTKNKTYRIFVDLEKSIGYCNCEDFTLRGIKIAMPCKHIYGYVTQNKTVSIMKDIEQRIGNMLTE